MAVLLDASIRSAGELVLACKGEERVWVDVAPDAPLAFLRQMRDSGGSLGHSEDGRWVEHRTHVRKSKRASVREKRRRRLPYSDAIGGIIEWASERGDADEVLVDVGVAVCDAAKDDGALVCGACEECARFAAEAEEWGLYV